MDQITHEMRLKNWEVCKRNAVRSDGERVRQE